MSQRADQEVARLQRLLEAVSAGDESAVHQLIEDYEPQIRRMARRRWRNPQTSCDSDDFAQAVWASFFRRLPELPALARPRALRDYLRMMVKHKVIDHQRRERFHRRVPLSKSLPDERLAPPLEAAQSEKWERLGVGKSREEREILRLWQDGKPMRAIASATGQSIRRIQRILSAAVQALRGKQRTSDQQKSTGP